MRGTERIKDRKRQAILQHAEQLFSAHGFERVSISEIARSARVSPATIYNHFETKQNLVREVLERLVRTLLEKYRAIVESERPFSEKVETIVFDKARIASQYQGELLRTAYEGDPDIRAFVDNLWQMEFDRLTMEFIDQGRRQGYVNELTSHEALALYLDIVRSGVFANVTRLSAASANPAVIRELNFLILYGLMGKR